MRKDVFINKHKWADIEKDHKNFFKKLKELKLYIIKFKENDRIKFKIYPANCTIDGNKRQPIIIITYDKYTFCTNYRTEKAWTQKK